MVNFCKKKKQQLYGYHIWGRFTTPYNSFLIGKLTRKPNNPIFRHLRNVEQFI